MAYTPKFDDKRIEELNKVYENIVNAGVPLTRKSEKAPEATITFGETVISGSAVFEFDYETMTLTRKESEIEMASMTSGLTSTKLSGEIVNESMVTLNKDFNGAKSFKFPKEIDSSKFKVGEKVVVTFVGNKCTQIDKLTEYVEQAMNNKPVERETRLPKQGTYITPFQQRVLDAAYKAVSEKIDNVILSLIGGSGFGKTSIAQHYARINNLPILIVDCSTISDNQEHFIIPEFKNGETHFTLTQFSKYLEMGNCVIALDEVNRMPSWVSNSLLPVTDHRKSTHIRGLDINVADGITFFYTSNQGAEYTGTNPLDRALKGRVKGTLLVDVLPEDVETDLLVRDHNISYSTSENIMRVMNKLRESLKDYPVNVSTRTSLFIAFWVNLGLTIREAVELVVLNDAPIEAQKQVLEAIKLAKV